MDNDTKAKPMKDDLQDQILIGLIMTNYTTREMIEHWNHKGTSTPYCEMKKQMEDRLRDWLHKYKLGILKY